jgi:cellulose synthase/poly-beta-1,6-N-acetylglucosamine synthase-like glycosyltransferase
MRHQIPGLSGARNAGVDAATGEIVAFLDDDTVPQPEWRTALLRPFSDPRIMATTGRIVPIEIRTHSQLLCANRIDLGPDRRVVDRQTEGWFEVCNFGGVGSGGNMAVRRRCRSLWSGFRDSLGLGSPIPGNEEHNLFFRIVRDGYRVAYAGDAVVSHPFPESPSALKDMVLSNAAYATAYATMLFVEEPQFRSQVVRYLVEAARGKERAWRRPSSTRMADAGVSRPRIVLSSLRGPALYARARMQRNSHRPSPDPATENAKPIES